jgi:ABC-type branched-subunit amino acid transport system ATPase component
MPSSDPPAILIESLSFGFGKRPVLKELNISITTGEVVALAGSNGAGKTTLLNIITGNLQPQSGKLLLHGKRYAGWSAARVARLGVTRTFQDLRLCAGLSSIDHLLLSHRGAKGENLPSAWFRSIWIKEETARRAEALSLLGEFGFDEVTANSPLQRLSYGQQKMVAFAASISSGATLLLLDEPTSGLSDLDTERIVGRLAKIRGSGFTIILIEHDLAVMRRCSDRVILLDGGRVALDGTTDEVLSGTKFQEAIFGHINEPPS